MIPHRSTPVSVLRLAGLACSALALSSVAWPQAATRDFVAKQVAAPPSDILDGTLRLPDAAAGAVRSRAAILPVDFEWQSAAGWRFETRLPVAAGKLSLAIASPAAARWRLRVRRPDGGLAIEGAGTDSARELLAQGIERRAQVLEGELAGWVVERYDLDQAQGGTWSCVIDVPGAPSHAAPMGGFLVARDAQPLAAAAYLGTHARRSDRELELRAQLESIDGAAAEPALVGAVSSARAVVAGASFAEALDLHDDGRHGDGAAGDGLFGVRLPAGLTGPVSARVELRGTWNGAAFLRTTRLAFDVAEPLLVLTGAVGSRVEDARRLRIDLGALPLGSPRKVQVSAEVWGRSAAGHHVPVAWLSRMEVPQETAGGWILSLWLDAGWLDVAGASPPLELRAVRVQDPDHHAVLEEAERLLLPVSDLPPLAGRGRGEITREMLTGPGVSAALPAGPAAPVSPSVPNPGLVLVHGYCSSGNVWPAAHFSPPKLHFSDPNASRSHDEFALLIAQQASAFTSFGVVGHSQGGPAALHLLTFYQSPLDQAVGPRRIQSVGAPYQGTPLASLGFFACGNNDDLTPSGSSAWLAGIPSWARAEVWYWTTSDAGSACNFFTSLILADPEDGTTEMFRGQLPGANDQGHVTGWCHTTGMSFPAQYTDASRNAEMDAQAAR